MSTDIDRYTLTDGTVTELEMRGSEFDTVIHVTYDVDGVGYNLKETLRMIGEPIRLGPFIIGQRRRPVIGSVYEGATVMVCYDRSNPADAFLRDNRKG